MMKNTHRPSAYPPMPLFADTQTFIVRVWQGDASDPAGENGWRGSITQVGSDRSQNFFNLCEVVRFIQEQTGNSRAPRLPWWQGILNWIWNGKK